MTACSSRVRRVGEVPLQDVGFVGAVRSGKVTPVAAVTGFEGDKVLLADGSAIAAQAVIAATGYRRGLEKMVGHLGVLDGTACPSSTAVPPAAPGLFFLGYTVSLRGMLRDIAADARRVAPAVARDFQSGRASSRRKVCGTSPPAVGREDWRRRV